MFTARCELCIKIYVTTCFETGKFPKMPVTHAFVELLISTRVWSLVPVSLHQFRSAWDGQQRVVSCHALYACTMKPSTSAERSASIDASSDRRKHSALVPT